MLSELIVNFIREGSEAETPYVPINSFEILPVNEDKKINVINVVRNLIDLVMLFMFLIGYYLS